MLFALGLAAAGCNKGPAEEALAEAEQTLEEVRAHLERFAPEHLASLTRVLDDTRETLAKGGYTEALQVAQDLPARIRRAIEVADRRREAELGAAWDEVSRNLAAQLARLRARVAGLTLTTSPSARHRARLEEAQAALGDLSRRWEDATAAFEGGDVARALTLARDVRARAEALTETLAPPAGPGAGRPTSSAPRQEQEPRAE